MEEDGGEAEIWGIKCVKQKGKESMMRKQCRSSKSEATKLNLGVKKLL